MFAAAVHSGDISALAHAGHLPVRDVYPARVARVQRLLAAGHRGAAAVPRGRGSPLRHLHRGHAWDATARHMER